ncbi:MAG TPA: cupin domain-containing protein [Xanthobacteraceae bacterium]|nr:cupin domain-containing protein [Xanthobacteraceae bacterium]
MELRQIRRVVTAEDEQGRSYIAEDGASPSVRTVPERPGYQVTNLWCTRGAPPRIGDADAIATHVGLPPPEQGTLLRVVDYPPESADDAERKRQQKATFEDLFKGTDHRPDSRHAGMHRTDTIDYAIVLEGEIVAIMDKGETVMRAGDILIQRGTAHAWANRSGKPARVAFVLLDAKR